jgi:hypothetical protein
MKSEINRKFLHFLASVLVNGVFILFALWLGKGQISLILFSIVFMYFGRRLGWWLSKISLYKDPLPIIITECVLWGILIAYVTHVLIAWQHPYWILKWIFGFGAGSYVSSPNFGLIQEASIPDHAYHRHFTITNLPFLIFVLCSILFSYFL